MQYILYSILRAIITGGIGIGIIAFFMFCLIVIGIVIKVAMDCLGWIFS
jgi:hypothetical protein